MIIYTGGTFDLFHKGHVNLLQWCRSIGEEVVVSLNTDEFIYSYKGKNPIVSFQERKEVLLACKYVDRVIPNYAGADSKPSILSIMPNIIVIGSDWAKKDYYSQMGFDQEWLDMNGIGLCYVPYTPGISTTNIKGRM
jgi:glycerol-3-phosphate cytidylyltransferase